MAYELYIIGVGYPVFSGVWATLVLGHYFNLVEPIRLAVTRQARLALRL